MGPTPALAELMCSVEETARNAGYSVIFSNSKQTSATPATRCELSIARCSLLLRVLITDGYATFDRLTTRRFPIIFLDRIPVARFTGSAVIIDQTGAAYEATKYLIDLGHTDIAIIAPRIDLSNGIERIAGFPESHAGGSVARSERLLPARRFQLEKRLCLRHGAVAASGTADRDFLVQ